LTTINKLRALLDKIEISDHLHEEQSAALEFALYGQDLLRVVEAANSIRQDRLLMVQIQILRREIAVTILRNV